MKNFAIIFHSRKIRILYLLSDFSLSSNLCTSTYSNWCSSGKHNLLVKDCVIGINFNIYIIFQGVFCEIVNVKKLFKKLFLLRVAIKVNTFFISAD